MGAFIHKHGHNNQENNGKAVEPYLDVSALWRAIWQRKLGILSLSAVIMLLTILILWSMTPIYRSTAKIFVDRSTLSTVNIDEAYDTSIDMANEVYFIKSRDLAKKVVRKLDLANDKAFNPPKDTDKKDDSILAKLKGILPGQVNPVDLKPLSSDDLYKRAVGIVLRGMSASNEFGTIIAVSFDHENPEVAKRVANALATGYINTRLDRKNNVSSAVTDWINNRLQSLALTLRKSQDKLHAYQEQHGVEDSVSAQYVSDLNSTTARLLNEKIELERFSRRLQHAQSLKEAHGWRGQIGMPEIASDDVIGAYREKEMDQKATLLELQQYYGDKHPSIVGARLKLQLTTKVLNEQVLFVLETIEQNRQLHLENKEMLEAIIKRQRHDLYEIRRKQAKLVTLQQEVDTNLALHDTFLSRLKEMLLVGNSRLESNFELLETATMPSSPVKPNKRVILFFTFIFSISLGALLAFIMAIFDNRLKTPADIEQKLGLPVLGIMPVSKATRKRNTVSHLALSDKDKKFSESVMSLRTSVVLATQDRYKSLLVTSSNPSEGKSIVAANLALALAQVEKVLLIDMDLRKPTVADSFDLPLGKHGFANLLADTATVDECIYSAEGIDIMPVGMVPPNPLSLLLSDRCQNIINDIASRYDRIIIDTPPIGAVSDALALSRFVDAVLYVVSSGDISLEDAQYSVGELLQNKAVVLGAIINRMKGNKESYYYSHSKPSAATSQL